LALAKQRLPPERISIFLSLVKKEAEGTIGGLERRELAQLRGLLMSK